MHFEMARHIWDGGRHAILRNTEKYSVSTSNHQNKVRHVQTDLVVPSDQFFVRNRAELVHRKDDITRSWLDHLSTEVARLKQSNGGTSFHTLEYNLEQAKAYYGFFRMEVPERIIKLYDSVRNDEVITTKIERHLRRGQLKREFCEPIEFCYASDRAADPVYRIRRVAKFSKFKVKTILDLPGEEIENLARSSGWDGTGTAYDYKVVTRGSFGRKSNWRMARVIGTCWEKFLK